jgi:DNA-binding transcriptional ArsR family regulator
MDQINLKIEDPFEALPLATAEKMADTFKGLADSTRLRLLFILFQGETCVNTLSERVGMSQSAVSHQLRILRDLGFVSTRREGQSIYYQVDDEHIGDLFQRTLEHTRHK